MPREEYQEALETLKGDVLSLGGLVSAQLERGLTALEEGDEALAHDVIGGDDEVNDRYLALEGDCIDLFALQQPVASDLRFVAASFKILTDLERVGDLATNFAKYSIAADEERVSEVDVGAIGADARTLLDDALAAYETADAAACRDVAARDDGIDVLCQRASERVVRDLIEREADAPDSWTIETLMDDISRLLLTIRDLERVGDHAVNIAARTLYMIEGDPELIY